MQRNTEQRRRSILNLIIAQGNVEVEDLAERFEVTSQTVRLDLRELAERGLIMRTHGGARQITTVTNRAYAERRLLNHQGKEAIGLQAASLIPNDCSVSLNIGTTTEQVARALTGHSGLVVISNNINIINRLMGTNAKELVMVGGTVRQGDGAVVGQDAIDFISRYKVDFAVIGASALDDDGAVLDFDAREVSVARSMLRNSRTKILVCDSSKFESTAPIRICDVADLDCFVTDLAPPQIFADAASRGRTRIMSLSGNEEHNDDADM